MRKVALMGGSFSPPHIGHIQFAEAILKSLVVDEVWISPCNNSLYGKSLANGEDRIEMCKLAIGKRENIKVCDWEIKNKTSGETYKLIDQFLAEPDFKDYQFYFAIGMDNAYKTHKWLKWEYIEKTIPFLVLPRKGIDPGEEDWFLREPHIFLKDGVDLPNVSSTNIRNWIKLRFNPSCQRNLNKYMDPEVLKYIFEHKLFE